LGTSFRMGRGRVSLLDRHVMNFNFGWKDCPFAALRTSPLGPRQPFAVPTGSPQHAGTGNKSDSSRLAEQAAAPPIRSVSMPARNPA
jgi:hypothetical protein